jgi:hypothetical protein
MEVCGFRRAFDKHQTTSQVSNAMSPVNRWPRFAAHPFHFSNVAQFDHRPCNFHDVAQPEPGHAGGFGLSGHRIRLPRSRIREKKKPTACSNQVYWRRLWQTMIESCHDRFARPHSRINNQVHDGVAGWSIHGWRDG